MITTILCSGKGTWSNANEIDLNLVHHSLSVSQKLIEWQQIMLNIYIWSCQFPLLEYSSIYSDTTGNLWFYSKVEATNFNAWYWE